MFFLKLFYAQLKIFVHSLPRLILGAAILLAIIAGLAFGSGKLLYNKRDVSKAEIILVMPEHDNYISLAVEMLKNMKSTSSLCHFTESDNEDEAVAAVQNGTAYGAIIFPDNFVRGVVRGENPPAKIIMKQNSNADNALFGDLVNSGCRMLACVQAGIYTIQEEYTKTTGKTLDGKTLNALNLSYVSFVMSREKYFTELSANATGSMSVLQYYISMGLAVFILMLGMSFGRFMTDNVAFATKVKSKFGGSFMLSLSKQLVIFIFYMLIMLATIQALKYFNIKYSIDIAGISIAAWLASAITVLAYKIGGNVVSGAMIIFAITLIFGFVGGAFVPTALLPENLKAFAEFSPVRVIGNAISSIFVDKTYITDMKLWISMVICAELLMIIHKPQ